MLIAISYFALVQNTIGAGDEKEKRPLLRGESRSYTVEIVDFKQGSIDEMNPGSSKKQNKIPPTTMAPKAKFVARAVLTCGDASKVPSTLVMGFERKDKVSAGSFRSEPKKIKTNEYEYTFSIDAPPKPGKFTLSIAPGPQSLKGQTTDPLKKAIKTEITVLESATQPRRP